MASKGQRTGMRGVYHVAAELIKRGLIVSPTSRSAAGADLLVTDESCSRAFSVQVKTNSKPASFWLVGKHAATLRATSHIYVLVNLNEKNGVDFHEYFVIPSRVLSKMVTKERRPNSIWYSVYRPDLKRYRDKWECFGAHAKAI
jgi:hypothetical protein